MTFLARRAAHAVLTLLAVSLLVFVALYVIGNPIELLVDPQASREDTARTAAALGLDQPLWRQYLHFVAHALSGDLGRSFLQGMPVLQLIGERLPATLELASGALLIAICIGIPLGLRLAARPRAVSSRCLSWLSIVAYSLPTFWVGLLLIMCFAVALGWLPPGGRIANRHLFGVPVSFLSVEGWRHLLLPMLNLAVFNTAFMIRVVRGNALDALRGDYVRFARARGLGEGRILFAHVLKNFSVTLVTLLGIEFGALIGFTVVTESVFGWPGMGKLLIDAITTLDRPVVVAYLLVITALFVVINLAVDTLYAWLDPRVRNEGTMHG